MAASANRWWRTTGRYCAPAARDDFRRPPGKLTTCLPNRPRRFGIALQRDLTDATASFLLGSLSGGRSSRLEAWTAARRQSRIPGLHRNSG
jgi:hypothetical protein